MNVDNIKHLDIVCYKKSVFWCATYEKRLRTTVLEQHKAKEEGIDKKRKVIDNFLIACRFCTRYKTLLNYSFTENMFC